MHYEDYTFIDFVKDEFYRSWVLDPGYESNLFWSKWIANHPEKLNEINQARDFILGVGYDDYQLMPEEDFDKLHENIIRFQNEHHYKNNPGNPRKGPSSFWYYAAAILLLGIVAGTTFLISSSNFSETGIVNIVYQTNETRMGAKKTFALSDGTKVKLNSESSLRFPEIFKGPYREVYLQGEAFFEVAENPEQPFLIHSSGFVTEVKGTSFNIRAYTNESQKIAVVTGLVEVYVPGGESTPVYPQQMAILNQVENSFEITSFDPVKEFGWRENVLHFDNEKLSTVFKQLERWYGVKMNVSDESILKEIYQGEYKDESLHNVLTGISFTTGFQFEIKDKEVLIE